MRKTRVRGSMTRRTDNRVVSLTMRGIRNADCLREQMKAKAMVRIKKLETPFIVCVWYGRSIDQRKGHCIAIRKRREVVGTKSGWWQLGLAGW